MPELAAIYSLGTLICWLQTLLFVYLWRRRRSSSSARNIDVNLRKLDLYWSEHLDQIVPWREDIESTQSRSALRSLLLTGGFFSMVSWAGWMFLIVIMALYRYFGRSRIERALFNSELARDPHLTTDHIRRWLSAELDAN